MPKTAQLDDRLIEAHGQLLKAMGSNIRARRLEMGLQQLDLAEKLDVYSTYISELETGKRSVRLSTLVKLAEVLETTPDALISNCEKNS